MLDGCLSKRGTLRHTPVGVAAIDFTVTHDSMQVEAGRRRRVRCEVAAVAVGETAQAVGALHLNQPVRLTGFLAQRGNDDRRLTLHVTGVSTVAGGPPELGQRQE